MRIRRGTGANSCRYISASEDRCLPQRVPHWADGSELATRLAWDARARPAHRESGVDRVPRVRLAHHLARTLRPTPRRILRCPHVAGGPAWYPRTRCGSDPALPSNLTTRTAHCASCTTRCTVTDLRVSSNFAGGLRGLQCPGRTHTRRGASVRTRHRCERTRSRAAGARC